MIIFFVVLCLGCVSIDCGIYDCFYWFVVKYVVWLFAYVGWLFMFNYLLLTVN